MGLSIVNLATESILFGLPIGIPSSSCSTFIWFDTCSNGTMSSSTSSIIDGVPSFAIARLAMTSKNEPWSLASSLLPPPDSGVPGTAHPAVFDSERFQVGVPLTNDVVFSRQFLELNPKLAWQQKREHNTPQSPITSDHNHKATKRGKTYTRKQNSLDESGDLSQNGCFCIWPFDWEEACSNCRRTSPVQNIWWNPHTDDKKRQTSRPQRTKRSRRHKVMPSAVVKSFRVEAKKLVPKKCVSIGQNWSSKSWSREVQDHADLPTLGLRKPNKFTAKKQTFERIYEKISKPLIRDVHFFISKVLDGESKLLSINTEIGTFASEHK